MRLPLLGKDLTKPRASEVEEVELVVGAQRGRFPMSRIIKLDDVLVAANTYYDRVPDDSQLWVES